MYIFSLMRLANLRYERNVSLFTELAEINDVLKSECSEFRMSGLETWLRV